MKPRIFHLPEELYQRLERQALKLGQQEGKSVSAAELVRRILDNKLPPLPRRR